MEIINRYEQEHPILVDKYLQGKEIEVDAVCDGEGILIPGIMEHIERAGVHSGDSISVYPAQSLSEDIIDTLVDYKEKVVRHKEKELHIVVVLHKEKVMLHIVVDIVGHILEEVADYILHSAML